MEIRFAEEGELEQVNGLRKQVHGLHAAGRPETFKPGFPPELRDHIRDIFRDPRRKIAVCVDGGRVCGYAVLNHITRPETPFMFERDCLDLDEFGVDEACRRRGIATRMIGFLREYAKNAGFDRIELNMWEFNRDALAFYEASGFKTYRRYMEMDL